MSDRNSKDSISTDDSSKPLLAELSEKIPAAPLEHRTSVAASSWLWIAQAITLFTSLSILAYAARMQSQQPQYCTQKLSTYSPALSIVTDDYKTIRMDASYKATSPYRGPPNPSVDAAWDKIVGMGAMSITPSDFQKLNASKYSVKLPSESGGGYMALLEFVHDIHCVNMLWKHTYPAYYTKQQDWMRDRFDDWREHMDHCAESLRQKLMCTADTSIITYSWVKGKRTPQANFNVEHKCRDFDGLLEWAVERQAPPPPGGEVLRPKEFVEFEEPPFDPLADS